MRHMRHQAWQYPEIVQHVSSIYSRKEVVMNTTEIPVVGLAWFRRESYDAARAIMKDKDRLPESFDFWLARAEHIEQEQRGLGRTTVRAYIDPAQFGAWCVACGLDIDAKARNRYAAFIASQASGDLD